MSGLTGAYKFMRGAKRALIPGETAAGQLSMLPSAFGRTTKAAPSAAKVHKELMGMIAQEAKAPFKASRLAGKGDPRAQVMGLARSEELKMKADLAKKRKKKPVPGSITPAPPRRPVAGPKPKSVSDVDDLFGVRDEPLGYM